MTTITIDRAVVEQALEALDGLYLPGELERVNAAITALRAALAQQAEPLNLADPAVQKRLASQWGYVPAAAQAEPVAWRCACGANLYLDEYGHPASRAAPRYGKPQQAEPVATLGYARKIEELIAQRDALLEALKTYGWHTEDCPQYPTHARPKNWPACTCGFDAAIKSVEETK